MKDVNLFMLFGAHISISKGYEHAIKEALSIGANTMQFFSRNPRGSSAKALDLRDIDIAEKIRIDEKFGPLVAHAPYTLNFASKKDDTRQFGIRVLREDLQRLDKVKADYIVLHPGNHVGQGIETGIEKIADGLKQSVTGDEKTMVLLETMAGSGTEVGYTFEQIYEILDNTGMPEKFGVCIDTCHLYGAGYDIVAKLDEVLSEFDKVIGLDKMKAIHLNDSKFPLGSRKDRHEKLGDGTIGLDAICNIISHPALKDKPFLLETPGGLENYKREIQLLKSFID